MWPRYSGCGMIYIALSAIALNTILPTNTGSIRCACSIRNASEPTVAIPSAAPGTPARTATELANRLLRAQHAHPDPRRRHFGPQRFREPHDSEFRCAIRRDPAWRHQPAGGRSVDDMPPLSAREHPRQHGSSAEESPGDVDL